VAQEQNGQVSQALRALGIHQILARSPQARGRSERAFGTIQGRLPQELRLNRVADYAAANDYLAQHFIPGFNRRFTVKPAQPQSAFVKLGGIELELVLSSKHERVVRNDNTVTFKNLILQLPSTRHRIHFVRCPVTVHQFANGSLGISYQGRLLARYDSLGGPLQPSPDRERVTGAQRLASKAVRRVATHRRTRTQNPHFSIRTPMPDESANGKMLLSQRSIQTQEVTPTCPLTTSSQPSGHL
jgi:hypothetical protein